MGKIVRMALEDVKKFSPLTEERIREILEFKGEPDEDCPVPRKEELSFFRPWYEVHR